MREVTNQRQKAILTETLAPVHSAVHNGSRLRGVTLELLHDSDADVYFVHAYAPSLEVDALYQLEGDERRDWESVVGGELG